MLPADAVANCLSVLCAAGPAALCCAWMLGCVHCGGLDWAAPAPSLLLQAAQLAMQRLSFELWATLAHALSMVQLLSLCYFRTQAVQLALQCLSFDFVGTCLDESSEDLGTIQVPSGAVCGAGPGGGVRCLACMHVAGLFDDLRATCPAATANCLQHLRSPASSLAAID